jgi:signal peptidase II
MVCADLFSKYYIFNILAEVPNQQIKVFSFFNLVMVWNRGVSFGLFNNIANAQIILSVLALLIVGFLVNWFLKTDSKYIVIALTFVIAGALGNIIDRIINGAVADFLDFHISGYHWPAFNLADSFVFIGAVLLIFEELFIKIYRCYKK